MLAVNLLIRTEKRLRQLRRHYIQMLIPNKVVVIVRRITGIVLRGLKLNPGIELVLAQIVPYDGALVIGLLDTLHRNIFDNLELILDLRDLGGRAISCRNAVHLIKQAIPVLLIVGLLISHVANRKLDFIQLEFGTREVLADIVLVNLVKHRHDAVNLDSSIT